MTKISLVSFTCTRCGKHFLSYVEGTPRYNCCDDGVCFDDDNLGVIHNNSFLNTVKGKRECGKCRKSVDLTTYMKLSI